MPDLPAVELSGQAHLCIQQALDAAWADSTLRKYCSAIRSFLLFCELEHIPSESRCPASEALLCAFASSRLGSLAGDSVRNHMSALKAWHAYHNAPWLGSSRLHFVLNGVSNLAPSSSSRPQWPPVTCSMLLILASHLDLSLGLDACCLAAACAAMWGQLRLGEILSSWEKSFKEFHIACRSDLSAPFNSNGSRKLHLPFMKVKKNKGEEVIICRQCDLSDPINALEHYLAVNVFAEHLPLFCYISPAGIRCLTRRKLLTRCNSIWAAAGIPFASGHSFHIGGTTELLLSGVPPDVVKALGRWSSDAFLCYWRNLDLLALRHIENLPPALHNGSAFSRSGSVPRSSSQRLRLASGSGLESSSLRHAPGHRPSP
ncbi:uncharacterized protein HD556DRAFT_1241183 [Suillus plorans]|uniref:Uncharacterized protein n=1 Tax=Suillus plorans TaxID=116603 RepID=A0A9P7AK17_9AGAM|nr:uncharacterized protein HD556DRAFT_1241183 [Suillus plorans]KAG1791073.1 hypothetical protein HD556DRAFT_1241183 [Suillus plorans]